MTPRPHHPARDASAGQTRAWAFRPRLHLADGRGPAGGHGANPEAAAAPARRRDEIATPPSAVAIGYAIEQPGGVGEIDVRPTRRA